MNENIHADMQDELAESAIFADMVPAPDPDNVEERAAHRLLVRWTKTSKANGGDGAQAIVGDELDVVFVEHPEEHTLALVLRERLGQFIWVERGMDIWLRSDGTVQLGKPVDDDQAGMVEGPIDYAQVTNAARVFLQRQGKKAYHDYRCLGLLPVNDVEQGLQILQQIRRAFDFKTARTIQGFGSVPVDPKPATPKINGFGAKPEPVEA